ncbi:MAG: sugar phosphate isomerase/epimerase [Chloroflexi bacterium]|nr:sugar phosphate isomerase/epimerase [Chloroflexota bacterium]
MFEYFAATQSFAKCTLEEACDRIAGLGMKKVDLWVVRKICEHLPPTEITLDTGRIRRALDNSGLTLHCMSVFHSTPEITLARFAQLKELGGKIIVRDAIHTDDPAALTAEFKRWIAEAEKQDITIGSQNHGGGLFNTTAQVTSVLQSLPSPRLGVAYAPVHSYRAEEVPHDALRALGKRLALFLARDWGPLAEANWRDHTDQLPGTGVVDFHAIYRVLLELNYTGPICIFGHGLEELPPAETQDRLRRSVDYLCQVEEQVRAEVTKAKTAKG